VTDVRFSELWIDGRPTASAWRWMLGLSLVLLVLPVAVWGDASDAEPKATPAEVANLPARPMPGFTAEREAAAMTFVRTHHPELAELLIALRESDPDAYQKAIHELFRTSERLAQIQERQPARYDLDLRVWKVRSRIELLLARLSMVDDHRLRKQLRAAFAEQVELEREMMRLERDRLQDRMETLDRNLQRKPNELAADVDQRLDRALRRIDRQPATKKPAAKPASSD
jgi:hypothetical protein